MSLRICKHFGVCGGCSYLDKPYEEQLEEKVRAVKELLSVEPEEVHPSPKQYYYRNRMDFVAAPGPKIGLNVRGKWWETVDIEECLLQSPESDAVRNRFREHMRERGLEGWDRINRRGLIRFLSVLEGKYTGERLIFVVVYEKNERLGLFDFLEKVRSTGIKITSIILGINRGVRDDARAEQLEIVYGSETITEKIGSLTYLLHPNAFFQPNSYTLDTMIKTALSFMDLKGGETVLELFSGAGTFTIPFAKAAGRVVAVESDPDSAKIAALNLKLNKVKNVELVQERAERVSLKYDYVILDPPRSGLSYKLVKKLRKAKPKRILYISCNPRTQARDIQQLGYKIDRLSIIDQFPQTPLIETIALLKK